MKHIIFYFSGTGNCLHVARTIAKKMGGAQILPMASLLDPKLEGKYESVGFIYPTYFQGLPSVVENFVRRLDVSDCNCAYYYGITTYGELQGNALPQLETLLREKGATLHYSSGLKMFSNYVVMYNLSKEVSSKTEQANLALQNILSEILQRKLKKTRRSIPFLNSYHGWQIKRSKSLDRHYQVNEACISCNLCQKVCPVNNIEMVKGKPTFLNHCEQCVACMQYCPKKAINYKEKTQTRRRYHHPTVSAKQLIQSNKMVKY